MSIECGFEWRFKRRLLKKGSVGHHQGGIQSAFQIRLESTFNRPTFSVTPSMLWLVVMRQIICNNKVDFLNLKNPWNQNYYPSSLLRIKTFVLQPNINSFHVSSVQFLELAYSVQFLVLAYSFLFLELVQFLELAYLHEGGRMGCG